MIDFHCHLDLYSNAAEVVRQCSEQGMDVLSVTTTPSAWNGTCKLSAGIDRIRVGLGLHPQLAGERKTELPLFERYIAEARFVGEVGLDGGPEFRQFWSSQVHVFETILAACSAHGGRILSIHSRHSTSAVLDCLEREPNAGIPVMHWFTGSSRELERAIDLGCWFSINAPMLRSKNGRSLVAAIPGDRILTETDGPFVQVGSRPGLPWDVATVLPDLELLWRMELREVEIALDGNLERLLRLAAVGTH